LGFPNWIDAMAFVIKGPVGFEPNTFTGPFLNFFSLADYLLPLAILEIYLQTKPWSRGCLVCSRHWLVTKEG